MKSIKICGALLFIVSFTTALQAQTKITIKASDLYSSSYKLLGDSSLWSSLVSLSERDFEKNEYIILPNKSEEIKKVKKANDGFKAANQKLTILIKSGAKVFADQELKNSEEQIRQYYHFVLSGMTNEIVGQSDVVVTAVNKTESKLIESRTVEISAILNEKTGTVLKRLGLLGKWNDALIGDLFKEADGIKTGKESIAKLSFVDGSDIIVEANTTALIRQSKIDKLNNSVKADFTLQNGSLLTKLSNQAKTESGYTLRSGDAVSTIRSSKFWASAGSDDVVKLSNYDGDVDVNTNRATISLKRNQGTIVVKGKAPMLPVELLTSPKLNWSRLDTAFYQDAILLKWGAIPSSKGYEVEISLSPDFDRSVSKYQSEKSELAIKSISTGVSFLKIVAIDRLGLRGIESQVYRIIRNKDTQPPALFLESVSDGLNLTTQKNMIIKGITEPGAILKVNGLQIKLNNTGTFSTEATMADGLTTVSFSTTDLAGNEFKRMVRFQKITPDMINNLEVNGTIQGDVINPFSNNLNLTGKSLPGMTIQIDYNNKVVELQTGFNGDWGYTLNTQSKSSLTIKYKLNSETHYFYQKKFTIQSK